MTHGASPQNSSVHFRVWAPKVRNMAVKISGRRFPMHRQGEDFEVEIPDVEPGADYLFVLDENRERPDPVSRWQPYGVHGPSRIVDPNAFAWSDEDWTGISLQDYIIYELHTGTFTTEGTFEAVISKIPYLKKLGITALELMPVAEFPGSRNWGYDGVNLYAPHSAYGGPSGLKQLVNACHQSGLAVVLDVVYNHLGPEGNYLQEFAPYFTEIYRTPWGPAMNFDGPYSDGVRRFFIENALYWLTDFHIDALRLDAIHGIFDFSAFHILAELRQQFHEQSQALGRQAWVIAESDLNDVRVIRPRAAGGYELDAQWHDEFHHAVYSVLTGSRRGFLEGFGKLAHIGKAISDGFVYDGIYSSYRRRRFGSSSIDEPGSKFAAFIQNHDQIANTSEGRRLGSLVSLESCKLAAAILICSPYLPLLFMGEEFSEEAPFLYFTSHGDPELAKAVREGRQAEYSDFGSPGGIPDPQAPETFAKSRLTWPLLDQPPHNAVLRLYRDLIAIRKRLSSLSNCRKDLVRLHFDEDAQWLQMERSDPSGCHTLLICNFASAFQTVPLTVGGLEWNVALWTASPLYAGDPVTKEPRIGTGRIEISGRSAILLSAATRGQ
jgi:maltooligosyltrehalose trehalohydrolase